MHQNKTVHRDIKPENILLKNNYEIKLCDFGFCAPFGENILRKTMCGTREYLAPEVANRSLQNEKVDIWCLGILLYELFHKKTPFESHKIYMMSITGDRERIRFGDHCGKDFRDIIQSCLKLVPGQRPSAYDILNHPVFKGELDRGVFREKNHNDRVFDFRREKKKEMVVSSNPNPLFFNTINTVPKFYQNYNGGKQINSLKKINNHHFFPVDFTNKQQFYTTSNGSYKNITNQNYPKHKRNLTPTYKQTKFTNHNFNYTPNPLIIEKNINHKNFTNIYSQQKRMKYSVPFQKRSITPEVYQNYKYSVKSIQNTNNNYYNKINSYKQIVPLKHNQKQNYYENKNNSLNNFENSKNHFRKNNNKINSFNNLQESKKQKQSYVKILNERNFKTNGVATFGNEFLMLNEAFKKKPVSILSKVQGNYYHQGNRTHYKGVFNKRARSMTFLRKNYI